MCLFQDSSSAACVTLSGFAVRAIFCLYEHIYSPIRQTQTEKYRYIQRDTQLNITTHVVIGDTDIYKI